MAQLDGMIQDVAFRKVPLNSWTTYHCSVGSRSKVLLRLIVHAIQHILYSEGVPDRLALSVSLHVLLLLALDSLLFLASTLVLQVRREGRRMEWSHVSPCNLHDNHSDLKVM